MNEIDALKEVLKIYGETSEPVSQDFYQGLCRKAIGAINKLQADLDTARKGNYSGCVHTIATSVDGEGCCTSCGEDLNYLAMMQLKLDSANEENKRLTEKHGICEWTYDGRDDDFWDTTCGETYCFIDGGIKDNRVVFCHHCGRLVKEIIKGE